LKQKGDLPGAAIALKEALRLQPEFAGAHTTLAAVLRQQGDAAGAAAESKLGAEIAKHKTSQQAALFALNSGKRLLNAGDLEGAVAQFQSAIASSPDYALAHFELGLALKQQGKTEEALREFSRAHTLDSSLMPPGEK